MLNEKCFLKIAINYRLSLRHIIFFFTATHVDGLLTKIRDEAYIAFKNLFRILVVADMYNFPCNSSMTV